MIYYWTRGGQQVNGWTRKSLFWAPLADFQGHVNSTTRDVFFFFSLWLDKYKNKLDAVCNDVEVALCWGTRPTGLFLSGAAAASWRSHKRPSTHKAESTSSSVINNYRQSSPRCSTRKLRNITNRSVCTTSPRLKKWTCMWYGNQSTNHRCSCATTTVKDANGRYTACYHLK
jgi:hypothetical protein